MSETLLERCAFLAASAAGNPTHYVVEQALAQADLDWRFLTFEVGEENLSKALEGLDVLGFRGVLVASEFRTLAVEHLDSLTPRAEAAGSVDCLVREQGKLVGDNTFGAALSDALGGASEVAERSVMVIGSGSVARSIAAGACDAGAVAVHIADSDEGQLAELVEQLTTATGSNISPVSIDDNTVRTPQGVSIVVFAPDGDDQATRPVIDTADAANKLTVVDTRLRGSRTGLLRFANQQGATIIDGVQLFASETALALERWTDMTFDRAPLQELAEEFLGL
ncbi:shikimate dehydrogenase family protein [Aeoliella sp.]|uniref:shikimate dehydrogenase family protein n=1 Tax=Aeoliella sp. TaxID=2795800 RepID=UPI003CCBD4CB